MADPGETDEGIRRILSNVRTIAMVGASPKPQRPSHGVMAFLLRRGYRVIPVNPAAGVAEILGMPVYPDLAAVPEAIDMVDVFRRSNLVPPIARQAIAIGAKVLWLQLGVVNHEAAALAGAAGLAVVMDRCPAIEIRRLNAAGPANAPS